MEKKNSAFMKAEGLSKKKNTEYDKKEIDYNLTHARSEIAERENKYKKGKSGLKIAVAVLAVTTIALGSGLAYKTFVPSEKENTLNAQYMRYFIDTVEQVDNIDLNLSKALISKDESALSGYLLDTAIQSELAENDMQSLPLNDENKFYTSKLINQVGDFSKYLNKKISRGESLDEDDYKTLNSLYEHNKKLKESLNKIMANMDGSYKFDINPKEGDIVIDGLNELENLSVDYPELIYDGPFSDGVKNREIKGLKGNDITSKEAEEIFIKTFEKYNPQNIESAKSNNGDIVSYNVTAEINGTTAMAQIAEKGGEIIMYSYAGSCGKVNYDYEYAEKTASEFIEKCGVTGLKPVWYNLYNNAYTINFAGEENGVIIYPDMIKVKICAETGSVIGYEATTYYTNHTERNIETPTISVSKAKEKVADKIEIVTERKAIVPFGVSGEKLCYEFSGEYNGETYYVYIDANSGRQVEMFKVIESTEGTLLM